MSASVNLWQNGCGLGTIQYPNVVAKGAVSDPSVTDAIIEKYVNTHFIEDITDKPYREVPGIWCMVRAHAATQTVASAHQKIHDIILKGNAGAIITGTWFANVAHVQNPYQTAILPYFWIPTRSAKALLCTNPKHNIDKYFDPDYVVKGSDIHDHVAKKEQLLKVIPLGVLDEPA